MKTTLTLSMQEIQEVLTASLQEQGFHVAKLTLHVEELLDYTDRVVAGHYITAVAEVERPQR